MIGSIKQRLLAGGRTLESLSSLAPLLVWRVRGRVKRSTLYRREHLNVADVDEIGEPIKSAVDLVEVSSALDRRLRARR